MSVEAKTSRLTRLGRFWQRHRTLFWTIHSGWALTSGVAVILIARERYGFVPWVALFLVLTWASTLFFSRNGSDEGAPTGATPGLRAEATSYLTRAMYQETLFFLLPFYAYSTVLWSPNVVFTAVLGGLALLACMDILFDRWLRTNKVFGLIFFAVVAFAAVNLLLPLVLPVDPAWATRLAAVVAVGSALPLALRGPGTRTRERVSTAVAALVFMAVALGAPQLVPPVPLRLERATFSTNIDRNTLELPDTLSGTASSRDLDGLLVLLTEVFAPAVVPTHVSLVWERNGHIVHSSREIEITAHDLGFRVWDSWRPRQGEIPPGDYTVYLRASEHRVFGKARIRVGAPLGFARGVPATD